MEEQVPENTIKAALLMVSINKLPTLGTVANIRRQRAAEDVSRLVDLNKKEQVLAKLVESGSLGEDVVSEFNDLKMEMRTEMEDVVAEANALVPDWGRFIVSTAAEVHQNLTLRNHIRSIDTRLQAARAEWELKQAENEAKSQQLRESATRELLNETD